MIQLASLRARKLAACLASPRGRRALRLGVAPSVEHRALLRQFAPRTVIDVGANRGQFSLLCLDLFPDARIIAFEPAARAFETLCAVTAGAPVRAVHAAIAERAADLTLNVTEDDDLSSLLAVGPRQAEQFGTRTVRQETVAAAPLSAFVCEDDIGSPALLKIDVQGAELDVLKGCAGLIARFDWIYVECSFVELYERQPLVGEVIDHLDRAGFRLAGVFNQVAGRREPAVQADVLFVRSAA